MRGTSAFAFGGILALLSVGCGSEHSLPEYPSREAVGFEQSPNETWSSGDDQPTLDDMAEPDAGTSSRPRSISGGPSDGGVRPEADRDAGRDVRTDGSAQRGE